LIGLILGTSEGKKILSLLNEFTQDLFVSTATAYGGELLKEYKFKELNTEPLDKATIIKKMGDKKIKVLIDASHPYALEISKNAKEACEFLEIPYLRYERPSVIEKFRQYKNIVEIENYEAFGRIIRKMDNLNSENVTILNTTGSRNIKTIRALELSCRIIHRVLPSVEVMEECFSLGVKVEDIIAIKGPIGYDLNVSFIKEYNAKALLLKDSGVQGGTEEKLSAAVDMGIKAFVIGRKKAESTEENTEVFTSEESLVKYIYNNFLEVK
jgi:precorrin-6A/cobalt-precorrin-6A reductase